MVGFVAWLIVPAHIGIATFALVGLGRQQLFHHRMQHRDMPRLSNGILAVNRPGSPGDGLV